MKAVILDRDGVVNDNSEDYYIFNRDRFRYTPDLADSLKMLQDAGFELFILSNQGGVSKSLYSREDITDLHRWLKDDLALKGIRIRDILVCPHHDSLENCLCRKPKSLLLERLIARYNIEVSDSLLIGDSDRDVEAAHSVGLKALKSISNQSILALCKKILQGD